RVDETLAARIAKASGFSYVSGAHAKEHSVEVQVPFIQRVLPGIKIVPIVVGYPSRRTISALANALAEVLTMNKVLIVASTDMSHFLPKKEANTVDARTISLVQKVRTDILLNELSEGANIMCGGGPVSAALIALRKRGAPRVYSLRYADSSEVTQDVGRVVGYFAAAVTVESPASEFSLTSSEKKELLDLARQAVEMFVRDQKLVAFSTENPDFLSEKGAFVTLRKDGRLRGCIGFIEPLFPLYEAVIRAAIYAATEDARFSRVSSDELRELEFEISILTPLTRVDDPRQVRVGQHGLVIAKGRNRGLLLPQVAVENGWSPEAFLRKACLKAGLREDAWKKGADIYVFEVFVFH
ncbi:MAG: AmmeMemoRadiSam system protein A, partial [Acidobacteriota bacterium]